MAHGPLPLQAKNVLTPRRKPAGRRGLHLLPFHSAGMTKAEASRIFAKFAERAKLPVGRLRAELIPESSWKRSVDVLRPASSQTMARLVHALAFATRTWQNEEDAIDWLLGPHMELGGATPFSMLRTESGGRAVEYVMAALEYGLPV